MHFETLDVLDDDRARAGSWNMAADEVLLCSGASAKPVLRFYRWDRPMVSLGYFESLSSAGLGETDPDGAVRRWTGGGVVRHGEDLTYSLIVPKAQLPRLSAVEVYRRVHGLICEVLRGVGIPAEMAGQGGEAASRECFRNPVACDVMVLGKKIAGAGQRWTKHGLLHQGSIQGAALPDVFQRRLTLSFSENIFEATHLLEERRSEIEALARGRYASEEWLRRVP